MSFFYSFIRVIRYGIFGFVRNGALTFATVLMLVVTISVSSSLLLFGAIMEGIVAELRDKADISVYFKQETAEEEILKIKGELEQFEAVTAIEYISRDDALARFKERYKENTVIMESLSEIGTNPLEASLNIKANEGFQYAAVANFLEGKFTQSIDKVNFKENEAAIGKLFSVTSAIQRAGIGVSLAFLAISLLIAFNTIRLAIHSLRDEIAVMKLVGASNWFIRGPFVVQGIVSGIFAASLALGIFAALAYGISDNVASYVNSVNLRDYFSANIASIFALQAAMGIGVGVIASLFAIRRYLRV